MKNQINKKTTSNNLTLFFYEFKISIFRLRFLVGKHAGN